MKTFKMFFGKEVLADEIASKSPEELVTCLLLIGVRYGIDRTICAIKNTYPPQSASQIVAGMNAVMRGVVGT